VISSGFDFTVGANTLNKHGFRVGRGQSFKPKTFKRLYYRVAEPYGRHNILCNFSFLVFNLPASLSLINLFSEMNVILVAN